MGRTGGIQRARRAGPSGSLVYSTSFERVVPGNLEVLNSWISYWPSRWLTCSRIVKPNFSQKLPVFLPHLTLSSSQFPFPYYGVRLLKTPTTQGSQPPTR